MSEHRLDSVNPMYGAGRKEHALERGEGSVRRERAIGIDMTSAMIDRARDNAVKGGSNQGEFCQCTIDQIPLPDASMDCIPCALTWTSHQGPYDLETSAREP